MGSISSTQWIAIIISVMVLGLIGRKLALSQLLQDKKVQHLIFGSIVSVWALWMFRTGVIDGLQVHFLWLTTLTLLLGFRWAICSATAALLGVTLFGQESLDNFGINFLCGVLLPISITYLIYAWVFYKLPKNVFIYIFLCGFIPGALCIALKMFALGGVYYMEELHSWREIKDNYLVLIYLLVFPEAMFNGMTITLLVIHKPDWVYTFYDKYYFNK